MNDPDDPNIYSLPATQKKAALQTPAPRTYPFIVVFFLAFAATVALSELYWIVVDIGTPLVVVSLLQSADTLPGIYQLTSYKILTAIPAVLPDIYSGNIVARRCKHHPYYCLAGVYIAVVLYINWGAQTASLFEFASRIAVDFLYVTAAFASLWYYRRKYNTGVDRV